MARRDGRPCRSAAAEPDYRVGLQYLRASGLAQARLQLAVLSGDRRRALREIDRLVDIDRQLECLADDGRPRAPAPFGEGLHAHLAEQQQAIAVEKLALTAGIEFPRLAAPERHQGELVLDEGEATGLVEDTEFGRKLSRALRWWLAAALICLAISLAVALLASDLLPSL
jgi:hypothetical protein